MAAVVAVTKVGDDGGRGERRHSSMKAAARQRRRRRRRNGVIGSVPLAWQAVVSALAVSSCGRGRRRRRIIQ